MGVTVAACLPELKMALLGDCYEYVKERADGYFWAILVGS